MKNDLVSVIVPTHNVEKYIGKCVESILGSTYESIELIVVDDKSDDCTLELLKKYEIDARVNLVPLSNRGGVSNARNAGLNVAQGQFVCFVDADDWIDSLMIEHLVNSAKKYQSDITICNNYVVYNDSIKNAGDVQTEVIVFEGDEIGRYLHMFMLKNREELKPYFPIGQPWATLYKRELLENNKLRFITGMQYKEDVIFNLYAAQFSSKIVRINEALYYYNKQNDNSLTKQIRNETRNYELDLNERIRFFYAFRSKDILFEKGLKLYIAETFIMKYIPTCVYTSGIHMGSKRARAFYNNNMIRDAVEFAITNAKDTREQIALFLVRKNLFEIYSFILAIEQSLKAAKRSLLSNS
jgi:glycosyltransferase involved in cell wall biosynthesis